MKIDLGIGAVSFAAIASACHGTADKEIGEIIPRRLVTDSREVAPGDLFCALKGKKDGHRYIPEAAARGAVAVIAETRLHPSVPHLLVSSTEKALGDWAHAVAMKARLLRIGITGSVGKTTLKDALASMLSRRFYTHATYGNYNNSLGLPFTMLSTPPEAEICICEIGVNHKDEMPALSKILAPHLSVITCIGHAHIGAFGTRKEIAEEKKKILSYAAPNGLLFVPVREPLLSFLPPGGIRRIAVSPFDNDQCEKYGLPSLENDIPRSFALAFTEAVAKTLGFSEQELAQGLPQAFFSQSRRKEETVGEILFIEDGYNASPESVMAALRYLDNAARGRRVAVLGDMLELGEQSIAYHRAMGRFAAYHTDLLFFFGTFANAYAEGAKAAGAKNYSVLPDEKAEMAEIIAKELRPHDTALFKASRALQAEKIAEDLKTLFRKAGEHT